MNAKSFFSLVEIKTKTASVIPFFIGMAYTLYKFEKINMLNSTVMFLSMILFDMTVTAANNYFDYIKAIKKSGYNYEVHNPIVQDGLKKSTVIVIITLMLAAAATLGIVLVLLTDYIVLILGIICFGIGIMYSAGPIPISRTPLGEIFSGTVMGFFIPFITIYINVRDIRLIDLFSKGEMLYAGINWPVIMGIIVVCIPAVFTIANIMLANNIRDFKEDVENKRYTLPVLIGEGKSIKLLKILFSLSYIAVIAGVIIKVLPVYSLAALLTLIPVDRNVKSFEKNTNKKDTFGKIVVNFVIINVPLIFALFLGAMINIY